MQWSLLGSWRCLRPLSEGWRSWARPATTVWLRLRRPRVWARPGSWVKRWPRIGWLSGWPRIRSRSWSAPLVPSTTHWGRSRPVSTPGWPGRVKINAWQIFPRFLYFCDRYLNPSALSYQQTTKFLGASWYPGLPVGGNKKPQNQDAKCEKSKNKLHKQQRELTLTHDLGSSRFAVCKREKACAGLTWKYLGCVRGRTTLRIPLPCKMRQSSLDNGTVFRRSPCQSSSYRLRSFGKTSHGSSASSSSADLRFGAGGRSKIVDECWLFKTSLFQSWVNTL